MKKTARSSAEKVRRPKKTWWVLPRDGEGGRPDLANEYSATAIGPFASPAAAREWIEAEARIEFAGVSLGQSVETLASNPPRLNPYLILESCEALEPRVDLHLSLKVELAELGREEWDRGGFAPLALRTQAEDSDGVSPSDRSRMPYYPPGMLGKADVVDPLYIPERLSGLVCLACGREDVILHRVALGASPLGAQVRSCEECGVTAATAAKMVGTLIRRAQER